MPPRECRRLRSWLGPLGLLASIWLAACGQRGPLVLPDGPPDTAPPSVGQEDADETEDDSER